MSGPDPERTEPRGVGRADRRGTWYAVIGLVVLLVGSYAGAVVLSGDGVPKGAEVAGVRIGGLSTGQAEDRLRAELLPQSRQPIHLVVHGRAYRLDPAAAGLAVDVEATVARAHGGSRVDPRRLWQDLTGTVGPVQPVVQVDQDALIAAVRRLARRADRPAVEPWIGFAGRRPVPHRPRTGLVVDPAQAITVLLDRWLVQPGPVQLPVEAKPPQVGAAGLRRAMVRLARPATARPVRLLVAGRTFVVPPKRFAPALRLRVVDAAMAPVVDPGALARRVPQLIAAGRRPPHDATVRLRQGRPAVLPARSGRRIAPADVADALGVALARRDRTARVGARPVAADVSTHDARGWQIRVPVSSAVARYRGDGVAGLVAAVDGTVLRPGGGLSLDRRLGPASRGVADASQLATAVFRAAFAAGMEVVERHAHRFFDPRSPPGMDATIGWPTRDLRLTGTSPYGVLVHAWTSAGGHGAGAAPIRRLHVRLWSAPYWTVTTRTSGRHDRTRPGHQLSRRPGCQPRRGRSGFSVDVRRDLHHGRHDRGRTYSTTYDPLPAVVCPHR